MLLPLGATAVAATNLYHTPSPSSHNHQQHQHQQLHQSQPPRQMTQQQQQQQQQHQQHQQQQHQQHVSNPNSHSIFSSPSTVVTGASNTNSLATASVGAAVTAAISQTNFSQSLDFVRIEQRKISSGLADLAAKQDQLVSRVEKVSHGAERFETSRRLCTVVVVSISSCEQDIAAN
jgi:hypothetical protein